MDVATQRAASTAAAVDATPLPEDPIAPGSVAFTDAWPINWALLLGQSEASKRYTSEFAFSVCTALFHLEASQEASFSVSYIELTLWLALDRQIPFPFWDPTGAKWILRGLSSRLLRPTLASLVVFVRHVLSTLADLYGLAQFAHSGLNRVCSGIVMPVEGLTIHSTQQFHARFSELAKAFGGTRALRKAADLARPL